MHRQRHPGGELLSGRRHVAGHELRVAVQRRPRGLRHRRRASTAARPSTSRSTRTADTRFRVEIYRQGYYGGAGARLLSTVRDVDGTRQEGCDFTATTGLIDCSELERHACASRRRRAWTSGVYVLRLVRNDTGADTHVLFVVRDDDRASQVLYGVPFTTYQAYNNWGGKSALRLELQRRQHRRRRPARGRGLVRPPVRPGLEPVPPRLVAPRSTTRRCSGSSAWATTSATSRTPTSSARPRWPTSTPSTSPARTTSTGRPACGPRWRPARDAGKSLFFSGANDVYWKIRFESSPIGALDREHGRSTRPPRAAPADPSGIPTGTWRDPGRGQQAGERAPRRAVRRRQRLPVLPADRSRPPRATTASGASPAWTRRRPARRHRSAPSSWAGSGTRASPTARSPPACRRAPPRRSSAP